MDEAKELIKTLENLEIQLFDIVNKLEALKGISIEKHLNTYVGNTKNGYINFVLDRAKDGLISNLDTINSIINNVNLIGNMVMLQLLLAGVIEVIKLDIEEEEEEEEEEE